MNRRLRDKYMELESSRHQFLEIGHRSAVLTIPSVQPREGQTRLDLPQNFQSVGARGVNNLASKLQLTLFPSTLSFFRLEVTPAALADMIGEASPEEQAQVKSEVEASLQLIEKQALSEFDVEGWRPAMAEAMRLLVVTGNALVYDRPGGMSPTCVDMRQYVVERDPEGRLKTVILRQAIGKEDAENYLGHPLTKSQEASESFYPLSGSQGTESNNLELYTGAHRQPDGRFVMYQEVAGEEVRDTRRVVREKDLPLIPLRFAAVSGESYGRGYVEDYTGDLLVLEQISRALAEAAMVSAKVIFLTRPGSSTKPSVLSAPNGSVRVGDPEDVGTVQAGKGNDLMVAYQQRGDITLALSKAFLLNSSVQRAGERVTGEEIRFVAMELEDALGGVYSQLAETLQRPIVEYVFSRLKRTGKVKGLPPEVKPVLATGLEAISRNHKATRIQQLLSILQNTVPPDQLADFLRFDQIAADLANALNLEKDQIIRTPEEVDAIQQQRQQQMAVETLGPEVLRQQAQQQPPSQ